MNKNNLNNLIRYEVDSENRLILNKYDTNGGLIFREVIEGKFYIDNKNNLSYQIKSPKTFRHARIPRVIKFQGNWVLTENHDLKLELSRLQSLNFGKEIIIKGEFIEAKTNSLVFAYSSRQKQGKHFGILKLKGVFQADRYNRLQFLVERLSGQNDALTFKGIWEINKNQQIKYHYKKTILKTKIKDEKSLVFRGFWKVLEKNKISYSLDASSRSVFEFKVSFIGQDNVGLSSKLKYEIGVGFGSRKETKIMSIFGSFRLYKKLGLSFEVKYANNEIHAVNFGFNYYFKDSKIIFELKSLENKRPGIEITLEKKLFDKDSLVFLNFRTQGREKAIETGLTKRW